METLLIRLILATALIQLGYAVSDFEDCHSKKCAQEIERTSRDILKINWKPIVVFPKEAKKFR